MEGMESVGETVLADIVLAGCEILAVAVHVGQGLHEVMLEHFVQFLGVGPALLVEVAVADGGADDNAVLLHDALMTDDLCGQSLHHLDGVGAHAHTVVEVLGHTEDHDIVLLFSEGNVGTLVGNFPAQGLHNLGVAGEDGDLTGLGVQNSVAAEEGMAHLLFHVHGDLIELGTHQALAGNGSEVATMHDLGNMVGSDASPVGDAGSGVLVAAGVAAVGVALGVADQNGNVAVEDVLVHQDGVAALGGAQIHHVLVIFGVMGGDLVGPVELVEQLFAQDLLHFGNGCTGVQAVGEHEQDVFLADTACVQLVQAGPDGDLTVSGGLAAALDDVGNDEDDGLAGSSQLLQSGHAVGIADGLQSGSVQLVPGLGQALGIGNGNTGDKHIGVVGQVCSHQTMAVFKLKLHSLTPYLPR